MLNENDVCKLLRDDLERRGFEITKECLTTYQTGIDLKGKKGTIELFIECKGATSSKPKSKNSGKKFDNRQIKNHISKALYQSACVVTEFANQKEIEAGIALPKTENHIKCIEKIKPALHKLGITIIWVCEDGRTEPDSPNSSKIQWDWPSPK